MRAVPIAERLAAKVQVDPATGCHVWTGSVVGKGYGLMGRDRSRAKVGVHRVAYELAHGPIPAGLVIDHLCRNRLCVNPAHLEAVSQRENILRGAGVAPGFAARTHCAHGHELSPGNFYERAGGGRRCKVCHKAEADQRIQSRGFSRRPA